MGNTLDIAAFSPDKNCLNDRCIMISGATGGLGSALALAVANCGGTVVLAGRNIKSLEKLYDKLEAAGAAEPAIFPVNLESATQTDYYELTQTLDREFGRLDGLVHCAAELGTPTPMEHYPSATWNSVMQVNVNSAFLMTRSLLPLIKKSELGSIVFTTDHRQTAFWGAYGTSKAALDTMASILADELEGLKNGNGHPRVSVNRVNPGKMRTKLRQKSFAGELPSESPEPSTKVATFLHLLTRTDPALHGELIKLDPQ